MMADITDSNSLECIFHEDQASCYCEECSIPVCIKCITGKHQGHKMINFEKLLLKEKKILQKDADKLENDILPTLMKWSEELNSSYENYEINIQQIMNSMEEENQSFKKEIDRCHFEKRKDIEKNRDSQSTVFNSFSKDLEMKISVYKDKLSEYRDAIEKNSLPEIYDITKRKDFLHRIGNKPKVQEFPMYVHGNIQCIKDNLGKLHTSSVSRADVAYKSLLSYLCCMLSLNMLTFFLYVGLGLAYLIFQSPESPVVNLHMLTTSTVVSEFRSPLKGLPSLFITKNGDVWLGGHESTLLVKVDIKGRILEWQDIETTPIALAVLDNDDIIICATYPDPCSIIRFFDDDDNRIFFEMDESIGVGTGISITDSQEILISTFDGRVVLMNDDGSNVREIYNDSEDEVIRHAVENSDGNIYISDRNNSTLTIVSKDGHVLTTITQNAEGQRLKMPKGMVVDTMGNILCADMLEHCVYIMDQSHQMRVLVGKSHGISHPRWLALDKDNNLWITQMDGTIHVVKYLTR